MSVTLYPLSTEKSLRQMETENKLCFRVEKGATKAEIKADIEKQLKAKVVSINTVITKGEKHAYVRFAQETPAIDIATNLGLM